MKTILSLVTLCLSLSSFAGIQNSNLDPRHEMAIENAVYAQCNVRNLEVSEISSQVDWSEVGDEFFAIKLNGTHRIDQGQYDNYTVEVKSVMWSAYDHQAKEWGYFEVQSVLCTPK